MGKNYIMMDMSSAEADDLIKQLDELTKTANAVVVTDLETYSSDHRAYFSREYGRFMSQFRMYFSAVADVGNNINYLDKSHWPSHRSLQFIIATHSIGQFYSAYKLLLDGAYEDAITIQRSIYEAFLRILFISLHPSDSFNAYDYRSSQVPQPGVRFKATGIVKDLGLKWNTYSIMSSFAHSNMYKVIETAANIANNGQRDPIALMYEKDDDMISVVVNFMLFLLAIWLKLFTEVFTVNYPPREVNVKKNLDLLDKYKSVIMRTLKEHSESPYWRQVGIDVDDLFKLVNALDDSVNPKWRDEWKKIRPTDYQ